MSLQIGRLVSNSTISRTMAFVEAVTGELLDHAKQFDRFGFGEIIFAGTFQELCPVLCDRFEFLLADRLDALIRLREFDSPQPVQNPHDLFLIDHHAVGLVQDRVDNRVQARKRQSFVFDVDVRHHHPPFQRAGPIKCGRRDNVCEFVRLHLGQQIPHPAGLELEDPFRLASLKQCKGWLVIQRQLDGIDIDTAMLLDVLDRLVEDREVAKTQKVHLQQSGLFDRRTFPLRDDIGLTGDRLQRDIL